MSSFGETLFRNEVVLHCVMQINCAMVLYALELDLYWKYRWFLHTQERCVSPFQQIARGDNKSQRFCHKLLFN